MNKGATVKLIPHFINRAAKAILGGIAAGISAASVYVQASPLVDFADWRPWAAGGIAAFGTGFVTYWTTNA